MPPAPSTNDAVQPSKNTARPAASEAASGAAVSGSAAKIRVLRPRSRDRGGDARQQAAAAERRDDGVDVRQILQDLEADRPVAGDEPIVVEWMHEVPGHAIRTRVQSTVCQHSS